MARQRLPSNRRVLAVMILTLLVSSSVSWWLGSRTKSPSQAAAEAAPPIPTPITAQVERRRLSDTLVLRGRVRVRHESQILVEEPMGAGRTIVTKIPVKAGDTVMEGTTLIEVSGRPVFALHGRVPSYRDLQPGMHGQDVAQFQLAMARLGYAIRDRNGIFGSSTASAVRQFYRARGYDVPVIRDSETAGGKPTGGLGDQRQGSDAVGEQPSSPSRSGEAEEPATSLPANVLVPYREISYRTSFPAQVVTVKARVGGKPEGSLLTLSSGSPVVEVDLTASDRRLLHNDDTAVVEAQLPDRTFRGRVVSIRSVGGRAEAAADGATQPPGDTDLSAGAGPDVDAETAAFRARIVTDTLIPSRFLDQEVTVTISTKSTKGKVLAVPLAAIWAGPDGVATVIRLTGAGKEDRVAVRPGLSADGFVAVRPVNRTLRPGDLVVVGR